MVIFLQKKYPAAFRTSNVVNMGILPDSLATSNNWPYIKNSFNGDVYIDNYDVNGIHSKY